MVHSIVHYSVYVINVKKIIHLKVLFLKTFEIM